MLFQITSLYAAIIVIGVLALSTIVSINRGRTGISINYGDDQRLALAIRRHGNLAENAALALILLALCEARAMPDWGLHSLGAVLVVSRAAHAIGLDAINPMTPLRLVGGTGTQLIMLVAAAFLVVSQF